MSADRRRSAYNRGTNRSYKTYRTYTTYGEVFNGLLRQTADWFGSLLFKSHFQILWFWWASKTRRHPPSIRLELTNDDSGGTEAVDGGAHDAAGVACSFTDGIQTCDILTLTGLQVAVDSNW